MARGAFREDVYYRVAVFPVRLPPLRDRAGDVPLLANAFLERFAARHRRAIRGFTQDAMAAMCAWRWPGNVREMENSIERAVIIEDGNAVSLASLPDSVVCGAVESPAGRPAAAPVTAPSERTSMQPGAAAHVSASVDAGVPPHAAAPSPTGVPSAADDACVSLEEMERRAIVRALDLTGGNVQEAANRLGISRATIYRKAERYALQLRS